MLEAVTSGLKTVLFWLWLVLRSVFTVSSDFYAPGLFYTQLYNSLGMSDIFGMSSDEFALMIRELNGVSSVSVLINNINSAFSYIRPLIMVFVAVSVVLLGVKIIKSFIWSR